MNLKSFPIILALFALIGCTANARSSAADPGTTVAADREVTAVVTAAAAGESEVTAVATATSSNEIEANAPPPEAPMLDLPDLGEAPEFRNDLWLNAEAPITLASLEGKVVLLEFWTFG